MSKRQNIIDGDKGKKKDKRSANNALGDKQTYDWKIKITKDNGNQKSCSLGVVIPRCNFKGNLNIVDKLLRNARLNITLRILAEDGNTERLIETPPINEPCEFHSITLKDDDTVSGTLTFERNNDLRKLMVDYAWHDARMIFARTGVAGKDSAGQAAVGEPEDPNQMSLDDAA